MAEHYTGIKFKTQLNKKRLYQTVRIRELIFWCQRFKALGLAPSYEGGSSGNLSFRAGRNFVITASYTDLGFVSVKDFVRVKTASLTDQRVIAEGVRHPSSETLLHAAIYQERPGIGAIFHGHSQEILKAKIPFIRTKREAPYGSRQLIDEVIAVLGCHDFILMKGHGFVALGKTMKDAGTLVENVLKKVKHAQ